MEQQKAEIYAKRENTRLVNAVIISILLHLIFILFTSVDAPATVDTPIEVELIPQKKDKKQIVSESLAPEIEPPKEVNKLSSKNTFSKKEQIKKGQPPSKQAPQAQKKLNLVNKEILGKIAESKLPQIEEQGEFKYEQEKQHEEKELQTAHALSNYRPFSHTNKFPDSQPGSPDHLPKIPDGDVTLLNAKAYKHAIFVRRVALKVFASLRRKSWQELPASEISSARDFVHVKAILSKEGKLISAQILNTSGSRAYDLNLKESVQDGAWDKNPPQGLTQADGNIHFIFRAKSWSRRGQQGLKEQRWTLLATGLL